MIYLLSVDLFIIKMISQIMALFIQLINGFIL